MIRHIFWAVIIVFQKIYAFLDFIYEITSNFFLGWKYVGNTFDIYSIKNIHPTIIKILENKAKKKQKLWNKKNKGFISLGRTIRGVKNEHDIPSVIVYVNGNTWKYKGKKSSSQWIDNHGHGGRLSSGMKIWRKLKNNKNKTPKILLLSEKVGKWKEKRETKHFSYPTNPWPNNIRLPEYVNGKKVRFWKQQSDDDSEGYVIPIFYKNPKDKLFNKKLLK